MTTTDTLTEMVLVKSEKAATIHAPVERVDIADWLLHLPDAEDAAADRQAASDDHNRRETALYAQSLERKALILA